MKKNLKYYLLMAALMVVVSMSAQMFAQEPVATMHSTSSMVGSGSSLPSAAVGGAYTSYGESGTPGRPRHVLGKDEDDEEGGDGNLSGDETGGQNPDGPIGAMPWVMMVMMAAGYAYRRRKRGSGTAAHTKAN